MHSGNANMGVRQAIAKHLPWKTGVSADADGKLLYLRPRGARIAPATGSIGARWAFTVVGICVGVVLGYAVSALVPGGRGAELGGLALGIAVGSGLAVGLVGRRLRQARITSDSFRQRLMSIERNQALWISLSAVLHDVRNPLHNITLLIESLDAPGSDSARVRTQIMSELDRINTRMRRVMKQVGEFSGEIRRRAVPLTEVIDEVRTMVEPLARSSSVTVRVESPSDVAVIADPKLLAQAVDHLMLNSLQILSQNGSQHHRLSLTTTVEERAVWVWVEDTGPGLPEPVQQRLFEPLSTRSANGMGLGLTIAHALASAAGGELMLARTGDHGTQFRLRLERASS